MKRMIFFTIGSIVAAGIFILLLPAHQTNATSRAAENFPVDSIACGRPSPVCPCTKVQAIILKDGIEYRSRMDGSLSLNLIGQGTTATGKHWSQYSPVSFGGNVIIPDVGVINVYLDPTRPSPISYMESLMNGSCYPARHDLYAWTKMRISSMPGVVLRSKQPFHMQNNSIPSFAVAGGGVTYTVLNDVEFEDEANPGPVVLTVVATPVTVNP